MFYIDFINLVEIFEKYKKDEFKLKVTQNIKTTIKIVFDTQCEFVNSHCIIFKYHHVKSQKLIDKIKQFELEFSKFNEILERTLDAGLTYKFAISTIEEVKRNNNIPPQLKYGQNRDIIISSGVYPKLSSELSIIKLANDVYKVVYIEQKPEFEQSEDEKYDKALDIILNNLSDSASKIRAISLNAQRGVGKTHLLNDLYYKINRIKEHNTLVLYAQCSALTQVSPYGLIQSFFARFLECSVVLEEEIDEKAFETKILEKFKIDSITQENLQTLINLIYPTKKDYFENILINKEITYKYLKNIFDFLKENKNIVLIIDDFDLIDESSWGFLKHLVNSDYFENGAKMILGYKNQHSISMYFQSNKLNDTNCLNISLRKLNTLDSKGFIKKILGQKAQIPNELISQIAYNAQGNIAYIEQIIQYLFERKILIITEKIVKLNPEFKEEIKIPDTLEKCFFERLEFLKAHAIKEYIFLNTASLLGDRLDYKLLANVFEMSENVFFETVSKLEKKGYLKRKFDDIYGFKNSLTWSYCYIKAKEEEIIKEDAKKLLLALSDKTITTPLICPILAQIIGNSTLAFNLWTKNLQYASYIGDVNIYAMAQKQSLILLENVKLDNFKYVKNNICERLGKLVYIKIPRKQKTICLMQL